MKKNEKIEFISIKIAKEGKVNVASLAREMNITEKTVRIYLTQLEKAGILIRTFGGAVLNNSFNEMFPITDQYKNRANNLKRIIASKAVKLINEGETIILDDGSTTYEIAKQLGSFSLTVITNDLSIAQELKRKEKIKTILIGGEIIQNSQQSCVGGNYAKNFIRQFKANKFFMGISSVDLDAGLMIFHHGDSKFKNTCMAISDKTYCIADSGKFNKTSFVKVCDINEVDYIITDNNLSNDLKNKYKLKKPELIISKQKENLD